MASKNENKKKAFKQPKLRGYTKGELIETFKHFRNYKQKKERQYKLIRDLYSGDFWRKVVKKSGGPQIKPDTNYIYNVATNIVNSVYAANYHANVLARHYKDNDAALGLNAFINYKWDKLPMKSTYPKLGKEAVLYNFSGVQVGWDSDVISGSIHKRDQGSVEIKHLKHNELYLDPSVTNYLSGRAIFINRQVSLYDLINERNLKEGALAYKEYVKEKTSQDTFTSQISENASDIHKGLESGNNEYTQQVDLLEAYFKVETETGFRIDQVFIADNDFILKVKEDIRPKKFPIRILYGEEPDSDPYGTPLAWLLVANTVALNLLDSIEGTHAYASQNRTKLFNSNAGINFRTFSKYGNTPNIAIPVRGNPEQVIKYVDVQQLPKLDNLKQRLEEGIQLISGVDPRYSGRETGSIQTTGGTDLSQQRIQSVTDSTRITSLEVFTESLTELVLDYYIEYGDKYSTVERDPLGKAVDPGEDEDGNERGVVDFNKLEDNKFDYSMHATPYLPRNIMRLSEAADKLMEMQGQYNFNPPLITHQEWIQWKDFPQKELIIQRMRGQANQMDKDEITATLLSFAGMVDQGMDPKDAVELLTEERQMMRDNPGMGSPKDPGATGQAGLG